CKGTRLRPQLTKTEYGLAVWAGEDECTRGLTVRTFPQQRIDCIGHRNFSPLTVLGCARLQPDGPLQQINLPDAHIQAFTDTPAVGSANLNHRPEPQLRTVVNQLAIVPVFQKARAHVVFPQPWNLRKPYHFGRSRLLPKPEHPLERC